MSAIHQSLNPARASGTAESLQSLRGGKRKDAAQSGPDGLFAAILAKAAEAFRTAQPARAKVDAKAPAEAAQSLALSRAGGGARSGARVATPPPSTNFPGGATKPAAAAQASPASRVAQAKTAAAAEGDAGRPAGRPEPRRVESRSGELLAEARAAQAARGAQDAPAKKAPAAVPRPDEPGAPKPDEERKGAAPRQAEPRLGVLDLRRAQPRREASIAQRASDAEQQPRDEPATPRREVSRELSLVHAGQGSADRADRSAKAEASPAAGSDFSSMLAQRLRETGNGEIVQAARIVLKDGDSGTIRLRLRPESLGEVKIELNLSEKSISGKIVVASEEAKSAFERNMAELSDAFRQGGFETAGLEVSVGSGSGGEAGGEGGREPAPFFSERLRAAPAASAPVAAGAYARRGGAVDILA